MWPRERHETCDPAVRGDPASCSECFAEHYGDPLAGRRCYFCSTDAHWWGHWSEVDGRLACESCADTHRTEHALRRAYARYRLMKHAGAPRTRAVEVYYEIVDFKDKPEEFDYLEVPLGNALAASVQDLLAEEDIEGDLLLTAVPSSGPDRQHTARLAAQAAKAIPGAELLSDLLTKVEGGEQKLLGRTERLTEAVGRYRVDDDLAGQDVIVLDDLIVTGGTLRRCAEALVDSGAGRVYGAAIGRVINSPRDPVVITEEEKMRFVEFQRLSDNGRVFVDSAATSFLGRFMCSGCPTVVQTPIRPIPEDERSGVVRCENCGKEHSLTVQRETERWVRVALEAAEESDILVSVF